MPERALDLAWMRVFDAVARLGSLTAAAAELGLSQPAVSQAVRVLEAAVGTPLFVRGHRGSRLTPAGAVLHRTVHPAIGDIDAAVREIRAENRRPVIRLFTDYGFASFWMMPRVADFRAVAPDAEVHIVASASADPGTTDIDVAVLFGARTDFPAGALHLLEERVVPVCSPAFAAAHGLVGDPAAITRVPLLHLDSTPRPRWFSWRDWLAAMRIERAPGPGDLSLNTYGLVVQAAIADQGVALGWSGLIDGALSDGTLVAVGAPLVRGDSGYWMMTAPAPTAVARRFAAWMTASAALPPDPPRRAAVGPSGAGG